MTNWQQMTKDEKVAAVRACIRRGLSSTETAAEIGASKGAVVGAADRSGLRFGKPADAMIAEPTAGRVIRQWTAEEDAVLSRMRLAGEQYHTIADAIPGRTKDACAARAKALGLPKINTMADKWWRKDEFETARRLRLTGMSIREVARRMGRDHGDVGRKLRSMGLTPGTVERSILTTIAARGGAAATSVPLSSKPDQLITDPVPYPPGPFQCHAPAWSDNMPKWEVSAKGRSGGLRCCGAPVEVGTSYCEGHNRLFYVPVRSSQPAEEEREAA